MEATFLALVVLLLAGNSAAQGCPKLTFSKPQLLLPKAGGSKVAFGKYVQADGRYLVVGAYGCNDFHGCAFMFERVNRTWEYRQKLQPCGEGQGDHFGLYTALSQTTVAVSSPYSNPKGRRTGIVYVFDYKEKAQKWVKAQELVAPDNRVSPAMAMGYGLGMEGKYIVVGARYASKVNSSGNVRQGMKEIGAIFVFYRRKNDFFRLRQVIYGEHEFSQFGDDVLVRGTLKQRDEPTMVVSAPRQKPHDRGAAFVFKLVNGRWKKVQVLAPDESGLGNQDFRGQHFGEGLGGDTECIVVGGERAPSDVGEDTGAAYIFCVENGNFVQKAPLYPKRQKALRQGQRVALWKGVAAVGAWGSTVDKVRKAGMVHTYVQCKDGSWTDGPAIKAPRPERDAIFGNAVHMNGEYIFIGSPKANTGSVSKEDRGAVYVVRYRVR